MEADQQITLLVRTFSGKELSIKANPNETVESIKRKINENGEDEIDNQKLTFRGKELNNESKLAEYKLKDKTKLMLIAKKATASPVTAMKKVEKKEAQVPKERKLCEAGCGFYG